MAGENMNNLGRSAEPNSAVTKKSVNE